MPHAAAAYCDEYTVPTAAMSGAHSFSRPVVTPVTEQVETFHVHRTRRGTRKIASRGSNGSRDIGAMAALPVGSQQPRPSQPQTLLGVHARLTCRHTDTAVQLRSYASMAQDLVATNFSLLHRIAERRSHSRVVHAFNLAGLTSDHATLRLIRATRLHFAFSCQLLPNCRAANLAVESLLRVTFAILNRIEHIDLKNIKFRPSLFAPLVVHSFPS